MKKLTQVTCLVLIMSLILIAPAIAKLKRDGRPNGGMLNYGEYGRPATLDPITSNDMIALRITELIFTHSGLAFIKC